MSVRACFLIRTFIRRRTCLLIFLLCEVAHAYTQYSSERVFICLTRERTLSTMCAIWRQVIKRIKMFQPIVKAPHTNMIERKKKVIFQEMLKKITTIRFIFFFFSVDVLIDRWNKQKYISQYETENNLYSGPSVDCSLNKYS